MPKIDFYILADTMATAHLQLVCRLVEKAYQKKHYIYIQTKDKNEATQIDQLLWTYRDDSFIAHNLYGETSEPIPLVQIGFDVTPKEHRDVLINLSDDIPSFYLQFTRILEVVSSDPTRQSKARDRYRIYRENNCEMTTHKI